MTIEKIILMVEKKQKKINCWKKKHFFFCVFFSTTATGFLFCFSSLELKERLKRVFESEFWGVFWRKKKISFFFHFFIIKWIYSKKSLSVWINQQNRFFFFLPQHHHFQLQHTTFSFKLNNPIIKRITNIHFFFFFLFFFVPFLQPSPSSFNQKTNKSKERPQEWTHGYDVRFFFWRLKRNIWSHFNPKKHHDCKCSLSSPLCVSMTSKLFGKY